MSNQEIHDVIIIGAGLGGLAAAVNLQKEGVNSYLILEKSDGVGGTWRSNSYPGCGCDTQMIAYQYSFAIRGDWDRLYPPAKDILGYCERVADDFGLRSHLRTGVEVTGLNWSEKDHMWTITTRTGEVFQARSVVMALGQFSKVKIPDIPGIDAFAGETMHTGAWDHSVNFEGKRVAVVGSAASAVQVIPQLARSVSHLDVYQRTPNWVIGRGDREIGDLEKKLLAENPKMVNADRDHQLAWQDILLWRVFEMNETAQEYYQGVAKAHLETQVQDPEFRKALTPDYPLGCKRILISDDFYTTLQEDHVDLVTDPIASLDSSGITTADGTHRDYDIVVWATGFDEVGWHQWIAVNGTEGRTLTDAWSPVPTAYLGINVPGFPNFYVMYGPNTNLGHGPITFMLERQAEYIARAIAFMHEGKYGALDLRANALHEYQVELTDRLSSSAWASPLCSSYYKSADGTVTKNWMGSMDEYDERTKVFNASAYVLS